MRYLDIARSVVTDHEQNERNEKTTIPAPLFTGGEDVTRYEKNESDEKSPALDAGAAALEVDPSLSWVHVYTGPVEASVPPEDWDGTVPSGCGAPTACDTLGPCRHFTEHRSCWAEGYRP